jgi:hypothetical protein
MPKDEKLTLDCPDNELLRAQLEWPLHSDVREMRERMQMLRASFERAPPEFGIQRTSAERESDRALIDRAAKAAVTVTVVQPAPARPKPVAVERRNKGGKPPVYNFLKLRALLSERKAHGQSVWFKNSGELKEWVLDNLERTDEIPMTKKPDDTTISRGIKKYKLTRFIKRA